MDLAWRRWTRPTVTALLAVGLAVGLVAEAGAISDPRDGVVMQNALNDLLSFAAPGRAVRYENPETGNGGSITALESIGRGTAECWDYERTFEQGGREMTIAGTACELEPGLWQIQHESDARAAPDPMPSPQAAVSAAPSAAVTAAASPDRAMVRETQQLLTDLGYRPGPVDGLFGKKTGAAIAAYQRDAGLAQTGRPSAELLTRLRTNRQALGGGAATTQPAPMAAPTVEPQPMAAPAPAAAIAPTPSPAPAPTPAPAVSPEPIVVPPPPPPPPVPQ